MSREFHTHREVGATLHQQLRHRQPSIAELCDRVEDGRLPADAGIIHRGARVDVCAAIEQQPCGFDIAELCGHVQQGRSLKQEAAGARAAAVQFRKPPVHQRRIGVELLRQAIELATEHVQHAGSVVPCRAARIEENVDAGAQSLGERP